MVTRIPALSLKPSTRLLGEVITWTCSGSVIRHMDLITALREADLDERIARELAPRQAFTRACKKLARDRVIRQVGEDPETLTFQFTAESRAGDHFEYELETMLVLNKKTGHVRCDRSSLSTLAQEELDRCLACRTASDVTRLVQKLFERQADLFAIREAGGAYFVPIEHRHFLDQVQVFLGRLNGRLSRFPVPAGTVEGDRSVQEAVAQGLSSLITEYRQAVAQFDDETRTGTIERAAEKIRQTRFKVEAYSTYLAEERSRLERELTDAQRELRAKVEFLASRDCKAAV
jgi:hypothetical protein